MSIAAVTASSPLRGLLALQAQVYHETRAGERPVARLMPWLLDRRNLEGAFERVRDADGADTPGVDGATCASLQGSAGPWLTRLAEELLRGRYQPQAVRWVEVPKPGKPGEVRRLGILTIRDRVVHTAVKQVLEPVLEPIFAATSFGFRPGRSVAAALAEATGRLNGRPGAAGFSHGLHVDVATCFDTVDHRLLLAELTRQVGDGELLRLVERLVRAGDPRGGRGWFRRDQGLVQGSALSPLLCNLALHPLDEAAGEMARQSAGGVCVLRYADDLLILARDARLARQALDCVRTVLARLQQRLRKPVENVRAVREGIDWLGVRLQPRLTPWSDAVVFGYVVPAARVKAMLERLTEMTLPPSERIDSGAFNLARWLVSINEQLRDWRQAYRFADNAAEVFRAVDEHAAARVEELLQSVTGLRRSALFQRHRAALPRGFSTWEVPGARLVVLSALAPEAPARLLRRPAWMRADALPAPALPAPRAKEPAGTAEAEVVDTEL